MLICDGEGLLCIEYSVVEWLAAFLEPKMNAKIETIIEKRITNIITAPIAPTTDPKTSPLTVNKLTAVASVSVYG